MIMRRLFVAAKTGDRAFWLETANGQIVGRGGCSLAELSARAAALPDRSALIADADILKILPAVPPHVRPIPMSRICSAAAATPDEAGLDQIVKRYYDTSKVKTVLKEPLTDEQKEFVFRFEQGYNIHCRAVAGAGKTTTALLCAARCPKLHCAILTYNKMLQLDIKKRCLPNVEAYTYHGFAGRIYGRLIKDDTALRACLGGGPPPAAPSLDVLVVDEAQDMNVYYFMIVSHLIRRNPDIQLIVIGDERQSIYEYTGANRDYLTDRTIYPTRGEWASLSLKTSQRLTPAIADFVNHHLYGADVLIGGNKRRPNVKPKYLAVGYKNKADLIRAEVERGARSYGPEGVFVLLPSLNTLTNPDSPIARFVRECPLPKYISMKDDDSRVDPRELGGKIAIMTFNSSKGRERPYVCLVGFDETYFEYYAKNWTQRHELPNVLTVAATRASAELVVVADYNKTIRTVADSLLRVDAAVEGTPKPAKVMQIKDRGDKNVSVTRLVAHQHSERTAAALEFLNIQKVTFGGRLTKQPPPLVRFGDLYESVLPFYGSLVTVFAEVNHAGGASGSCYLDTLRAPQIVEEVTNHDGSEISLAAYASYPAGYWEGVTEAINNPWEERSAEEWAMLAVAWNAVTAGRHHIAQQIKSYTWVDTSILIEGVSLIREDLAGKRGEFEKYTEFYLEPLGVMIRGFMDFREASGVVWEYKLGGEPNDEHILQLGCYLSIGSGCTGYLRLLGSTVGLRVSIAPENKLKFLSLLADRAEIPAKPARDEINRYLAKIDDDGSVPDYDGAQSAAHDLASTLNGLSLDDPLSF